MGIGVRVGVVASVEVDVAVSVKVGVSVGARVGIGGNEVHAANVMSRPGINIFISSWVNQGRTRSLRGLQ